MSQDFNANEKKPVSANDVDDLSALTAGSLLNKAESTSSSTRGTPKRNLSHRLSSDCTHNVISDSYELLNYVNKIFHKNDPRKLHEMDQKISNFYFSQQYSDSSSESYKIILDKLLAIWKLEDNRVDDYGSEKVSQVYTIYSEYMKGSQNNCSLLFRDVIKLWVYMTNEDVPENADDDVSSTHRVKTIYNNREVTVENIQKNLDKLKHPSFANASTDFSGSKNYLQRQHPVVPKDGQKNILITSALPYVNNVPHLGNIIGCVLSGDVYSRYCRVRGYNSLYICGTDEYGTATEIKAASEGLTCEQLCDKYHQLHKAIYDWFDIDFDYFGRTTNSQQREISQNIFLKMHHKGCFYKDTIKQLFCPSCDRFLADRFVEGGCPHCAYVDARGDQCDSCGKLVDAVELADPKCKMCRSTPQIRTSKHMYFDLPKMQNEIEEWFNESHTKGQWSTNAVSITKNWLRDGLTARCVTRDLKWGTPVPVEGFENKVLYVWFDAPIGYISITAEYAPNHWKDWWLSNGSNRTSVKLTQFMAKDNIPFHTVIFPASLLATSSSYTMLNDISCTEYLNYENEKFSKSRGTGVFGDNAKDSGIPSDIFRYYLLANRPENQDTNFNWNDLIMKNNGDLLNNLGNFVNRAIAFVYKNYNGNLPKPTFRKEDAEFVCVINQIINNYIKCMESYQFKESIRYILELSRCGNLYFQTYQPWKLIKSEDSTEKEICATVCSVAINLCFLIASVLYPFMPATSKKICSQLNVELYTIRIKNTFNIVLHCNHKINEASPLFVKLPDELADEMRVKFGGGGSTNSTNTTTTSSTSTNKQAPINGKSNRQPKKTQDIGPPDWDYVNSLQFDQIEAAVKSKADHIRDLKSKKAEKSVINKEVATLLALKEKLDINK